MNASQSNQVSFADDNPRGADTVVEVPVLLESWLLPALEATACRRGMTTGVLVRRLIRDFLHSAHESSQ